MSPSTALPLWSSTREICADLDAGDVDGLALARRDRLARLELALELVEVLADERHPGRQRQALVGEDVARHADGEHQQHDDGGEVRRVLADRGHGVAVAVGVSVGVAVTAGWPKEPTADHGPLTSGFWDW